MLCFYTLLCLYLADSNFTFCQRCSLLDHILFSGFVSRLLLISGVTCLCRICTFHISVPTLNSNHIRTPIFLTSCVCLCVCVCLLPLSCLNGQTYRPEFWYVSQVNIYLGQDQRSRSKVKVTGSKNVLRYFSLM